MMFEYIFLGMYLGYVGFCAVHCVAGHMGATAT